ncbi:PREDICTED: pleckstrin homology domain-containing family A member 7 isoform X7 [Cyprinodon variegatus]|uniref:pleckstrin homology domain-containing family A member 7 isoform X7 n=1 Tax=Cyprinodon variegatus TaxID=28743 RepID=UPI000742AE34|nr:PREDICTED: pleckstrin homology domain-containing family A member 7 isoform X7 [Cyprinodon variegatus]
MAAPLGRDTLPDHWSYGVCRDGRVFFINDQTCSTTWLHPRTGEPVNSGHMIRSDLPRGWEEGFTEEGASYFINHNLRSTSFLHPVTRQISPDNIEYTLQDRIESRMSKLTANQRSPSMVTESPRAVTSAAVDAASGSKGFICSLQISRGSGKVHSFGKRDHAIKRNLNIPVVVRGWLYKQDSSGMRLWKRKWFVLSDYCLFYYKDSREETVLGSIPLPSYVITPVEPEDHINRKYAFKAEHCGMRTYFFSADTQEDMNGWIRAMNQAALMQQSHTIKREMEKPLQQALPQTNHIHNAQNSSQPDGAHRPDRGEPQDNEIRLAHGEVGRYGLEVQGKASHAALQERVERVSPDAVNGATHKDGQQTVIQVTLPPEQNGSVVYQRGFVSRSDSGKHVQRKNTLAQVEQWVKVHKSDPTKSTPSTDYKLPRRTPPLKPKSSTTDASYQSLPKSPRLLSGSSSPSATCNLPSDYKYAHDRLSHFRMSTDERMATKEGMVWQLYEWQQRQQFRHGSPTAPIYTGPNFADSSSFRVTVEMPRSISVPPSPCEVPPSVPSSFKPLSPRRPHTPSDRRTVRPLDELGLEDSTRSSSPGNICAHLSQTSQIERRSVPTMGYITHTVSAPSLHGKTADDTYIQLKKDLEYLDLKVTGQESFKKERLSRPVKIAESDVDVKLSRLCEQDKILQELEAKIRSFKDDKDKLESVLDVSHQQMEEYRDQPAHAEKIAYQQKLLQEDVVHIRAEISQVSTEMENAWNEYNRLERDVDWLRSALQGQMNRSDLSQQEKVQLRKELWRIEDVIAGLSTNKANYKVTIASVTNPEKKFVPSVPVASVPSVSGSQTAAEVRSAPQQQHSPHLSHDPTLTSSSSRQPLHHSTTIFSGFKWGEDDVPPRPPLPQLYSPEEHPPAVPPLPRETTVIRHTSVRGLKRQSDERKRDREIGQYTNGDSKVELRPFLSDPELIGSGDSTSHSSVVASGHQGGYQTLPNRGVSSSSLRVNQSSSISSYVTIRRSTSVAGVTERAKSALERLYSGDKVQHQQRGKMSADEQLERMKRHQKALVRQRKRTLSHGDRHASPTSRASSSSRPLSADFGSWKREQEFDLQLLERAVQGEEAQAVRSVQGEERPPEHKERPRSHSDEWLAFHSTTTTPPTHEADLETLEYDLDLNKELSKPDKVLIPERYVDSEPDDPLSPQEVEERHRKVERIKSILAKSSVQNIASAVSVEKPEVGSVALDSALQEQERIITMSYALASEASLKSKLVAAQAISGH